MKSPPPKRGGFFYLTNTKRCRKIQLWSQGALWKEGN